MTAARDVEISCYPFMSGCRLSVSGINGAGLDAEAVASLGVMLGQLPSTGPLNERREYSRIAMVFPDRSAAAAAAGADRMPIKTQQRSPHA